MATFLVRSRRGCVGWLAAFAFIAHLTVADKSNNRYCDSKLGQYDEKCSSSDAAPAAGRGEPRLDRAPAAKQQRTGSSQGSAWGDVWGSKPLRWMWGTPVYSAQLQLSAAEIAVVLEISANAASIRLHRAREKLRDQLRKNDLGAGHEETTEGRKP